MASRLPADVQRFLLQNIRSVAELEVLLLLQQDVECWWSAEDVNRELRTSLHSASRCLAHLRAAQLLEQSSEDPPAFRLRPTNAEDAIVLKHLAQTFRERMAAVIEAIYAPKQTSLRDFADAFRLKNEEDDEDG